MKYLFVLLLPALSMASIWPEKFGALDRGAVHAVEAPDPAVWQEYGFQEGEEAVYTDGASKIAGTAYRFQDSTGALAAYQGLRPADARNSSLGKLASESARQTVLAHGNYVLVFEGRRPEVAEIAGLIQSLPRLEQSPLPTLTSYLPSDNRLANSERYVIGPAGLAKFDPSIPASVAGFHLGSEAQVGTFRLPGGDLKLAIFSFPTPQIAMQKVQDFEKIPNAMAKRTGPLVAVITSPGNADEAEKLLAKVRYEAQITWSERVPTRRDNIGDLIINVFVLIGILLAFSTVAGIAFGGLRAVFRGGGATGAESDAMITLHLGDRRPYP